MVRCRATRISHAEGLSGRVPTSYLSGLSERVPAPIFNQPQVWMPKTGSTRRSSSPASCGKRDRLAARGTFPLFKRIKVLHLQISGPRKIRQFQNQDKKSHLGGFFYRFAFENDGSRPSNSLPSAKGPSVATTGFFNCTVLHV